MYLNINDTRLVEFPTPIHVHDALCALAVDDFAILSRDDEHYIQTCIDDDGHYVLEYRDGSEERHYALVNRTVTINDVTEAFRRFMNGDDLQQHWSWQAADCEPSVPGQGEVEYNGVIMDADWPAQIVAAQEMHTLSFDGVLLKRIPFGSETGMPTSKLPNCGDCGALSGQLHVPDCDVEQCPKCNEQITSCGCNGLPLPSRPHIST